METKKELTLGEVSSIIRANHEWFLKKTGENIHTSMKMTYSNAEPKLYIKVRNLSKGTTGEKGLYFKEFLKSPDQYEVFSMAHRNIIASTSKTHMPTATENDI